MFVALCCGSFSGLCVIDVTVCNCLFAVFGLLNSVVGCCLLAVVFWLAVRRCCLLFAVDGCCCCPVLRYLFLARLPSLLLVLCVVVCCLLLFWCLVFCVGCWLSLFVACLLVL